MNAFDYFWRDKETKQLPKWVKKTERRWYDRQRIRPYDKIVMFKGKHYVYKVHYETVAQGQISIHWKRRRRIKI